MKGLEGNDDSGEEEEEWIEISGGKERRMKEGRAEGKQQAGKRDDKEQGAAAV